MAQSNEQSISELRQKASNEMKALAIFVFVSFVEALGLFFSVKTLFIPDLSFTPQTLLASSFIVYLLNKPYLKRNA